MRHVIPLPHHTLLNVSQYVARCNVLWYISNSAAASHITITHCNVLHIEKIAMCYGVASISRHLKIIVSFAKETYKRDDILQKRPIILRSLLIVATPYAILLPTATAFAQCVMVVVRCAMRDAIPLPSCICAVVCVCDMTHSHIGRGSFISDVT